MEDKEQKISDDQETLASLRSRSEDLRKRHADTSVELQKLNAKIKDHFEKESPVADNKESK